MEMHRHRSDQKRNGELNTEKALIRMFCDTLTSLGGTQIFKGLAYPPTFFSLYRPSEYCRPQPSLNLDFTSSHSRRLGKG